MGCCLFALILSGAPRIALILWWFLEPTRIQLTFNTWIYPLIGLFILPWTTLAYIWAAPLGMTTFEWILVFLALVLDIGSLGGGYQARRQQTV